MSCPKRRKDRGKGREEVSEPRLEIDAVLIKAQMLLAALLVLLLEIAVEMADQIIENNNKKK